MLKRIATSAMICLLAGCSQPSTTVAGKRFALNEGKADEQLLLRTGNYSGLIKMKQQELKKNNSPETRYQLAEYYYLSGDFNSSLFHLQKLLAAGGSLKVYLLESKNLSSLKKYKEALSFVAMALNKNKNNGEALNLKGVIQAEMGDLKGALASFELARNAYFQEESVVNNIAMIYIVQKRYHEAVQMLLPVYLRGYRNPQLEHNLAFALVKTGDLRYAKEIIKRGNYAKNPDMLVADLFRVESF
ncbi:MULTISPECIES: tetratricopeptide repeat protein [Tatumella]|uniref:Uncharacterized protein n=1 Tax=Tatumella morbirosei TaxID=642227 RepID=A0A095TDT2_9GAMM|nr:MULTISPECIES: hypothetical protein [Tatumella]KGD75061.1 hypothetical protein HA49_07265 [Tatumella morbirosei]